MRALKYLKFYFILLVINTVLAFESTKNNIFNNITTRSSNMQNLENGVNCLLKFLNYASINSRPITLLTTKSITDASTPESDLVLKNIMKSDLPTYLVSGRLDSGIIYSTSLYAIILIEKPSMLEYYKTTELLYLCSRDCILYIVIISKPYLNEESFLEDFSYLINILWKKKYTM